MFIVCVLLFVPLNNVKVCEHFIRKIVTTLIRKIVLTFTSVVYRSLVLRERENESLRMLTLQ